MCNYQGYEFGAGSYPDSVCIGGRLWDADYCDEEGNLYDREEDIPCPMCRPRHAIKWWAECNTCHGASKKDALFSARSLVKDIRKNRGVLNLYGRAECRNEP